MVVADTHRRLGGTEDSLHSVDTRLVLGLVSMGLSTRLMPSPMYEPHSQ
jgi:hypothetical protein